MTGPGGHGRLARALRRPDRQQRRAAAAGARARGRVRYLGHRQGPAWPSRAGHHLTDPSKEPDPYEALRAGASGFLLKDAAADDLLQAIRVIAAGEALLAPSITRRLIEDYARRPAPRHQPDALADLTARELEVMRLLARGMSNTDIARELFLGDATIKTHVARIFAKLSLHDRPKPSCSPTKPASSTPATGKPCTPEAPAAPPGPLTQAGAIQLDSENCRGRVLVRTRTGPQRAGPLSAG